MTSHRKFWPYGVYLLITILILAPLLKRGYVLSLDMVFTPHLHLTGGLTNDYLLRGLLHVVSYLLPEDIAEKLILLAILLLSGLGADRLYRYVVRDTRTAAIGRYSGGILYMLNPFTYDRFMAGQYDVLIGYALLPWFVQALLRLLAKPRRRPALIMTAWLVAISIASLQVAGFAILFALVGTGVHVWRRRGDRKYVLGLIKLGFLSTVVFLVAGSYWLVPLAAGHSNTSAIISNIGNNDRTAFATVGSNVFGRLANVMRLQGFWVEAQGQYYQPQDRLPLWGLITLAIWALVAAGFISFWRTNRAVAAAFGISVLLAAVLAIGTLNGWLASHIPFFAGYREPQKFVAVIAVAYAVFAARGSAIVIDYFQRQQLAFIRRLVVVALAALPLLWSSIMLWGFGGQLAAVNYPDGWYAANARLDADRTDFQVLFLPWHMYMYFGFAGRLILNPSSQFFDKPIISSNNPEFAGLPSQPNVIANRANVILYQAANRHDLGAQLALLQVKYILVAKEGDFENYGYLNNQPDLHLISVSPSIDIYKNLSYRGN